MPSPSLTLSRLSVVALGAVVLGCPAWAGHLQDLGDGAGSVEIEGLVEVPLLKGVDTGWYPAVLAQGPDKDEPDEFLLKVEIGMGPSRCTERVAKALGGTIKERVLARFSTGFGKSTKITEKVAVVPEIRVKGASGELVIRDWRCVIDKKEDVIGLTSMDELSVAMLTDKGVLTVGPASSADQVLALVGPAAEGTLFAGPSFGYVNGTPTISLSTGFLIPGTVLGNDTIVSLQFIVSGHLSTAAGDLPGLDGSGGVLRAAGEVSVAGVPVGPSSYVVYDKQIATILGETESDDIVVGATLGSDQLVRMNVAIDPAGKRVAVAAVQSAMFKDPSDKMLEDLKKQFDKGDKSALLRPLNDGPARGMLVATATPSEVCDPDQQMRSVADSSADGIRYFGAPTVIEDRDACKASAAQQRVDSAESNDDDDASTDAADDSENKEASRYADWADALLKHARYSEGYDALTKANELAVDDCSYFSEYAEWSIIFAKTDVAISNAQKATELYDRWASQDLGVRLAVDRGDDVPDGTYKTKQADECYVSAGLWAKAALVKGNHTLVESLYKSHMDLDEDLAAVTALSRMQRGQPGRARPLVLQALKVGGRGDAEIRSLNAIVSARMGNSRSANAAVSNVGIGPKDLHLANLLSYVAAAREAGGEKAVKALTERLIADAPQEPAVWAVHGLEAIRRGDGGAQAQVAEVAADVTARWMAAKLTFQHVCDSAALFYVAGDEASGDNLISSTGEAAMSNAHCLTAKAIKAALAGDAQATTNALNELAVRHPMAPLGTLGLLPALPPSTTDGGTPE